MAARISDVTDLTRDRAWTCSGWTAREPIEIILLRNLRWLTTRMFLRCSRWRRVAVGLPSPHSGSPSSTTRRRRPTTSGSRSRRVPSTRKSNTFLNTTNSSIRIITPCLITLVSITKAITANRWAISSHQRNRNPCKQLHRSQSRQRKKTLITRNNFIFSIKAGERISHWSRSLRRRRSEIDLRPSTVDSADNFHFVISEVIWTSLVSRTFQTSKITCRTAGRSQH